jgi:hypothetical protein
VKIQDGVDAADVTDIVIVKVGNAPYSETVNIAKAMTLTGDSAAFVGALPASRNPSLLPLISHDTGSTGIIVGGAGANITIKYLALRHTLDGAAIDANNANLGVDWFYVNPVPGGRTGRGISVKNPVSVSSIRNAFVNSVFGYGVRVEGATNATVSAVQVSGVDSLALTSFRGTGIEAVNAPGIKIELSKVRGTEGAQIQVATSNSARIRQNDLAGRHQLLKISGTTTGTSVDTNSFNLRSQPDDPDNVGSSDGRSGLEISSSSSVKVTGNTFDEGLGSRLMDAIRLINTTQTDSVGGTSTSLNLNHFTGGRYNVNSSGSKWDMQKSRSQGADYAVFATSGDVISLLDDTLTNANVGCVVMIGSAARFYADRVKFDSCVPSSASNAMAAVDVNGTLMATKPIVRITQSAFRGPNQTAVSVQQGKALIMVEDTLLGQASTAVFSGSTLGAVYMTQSGGLNDSLRLSANVIKGYPEVAAVNANGTRLTMLNNVLTRNKFGIQSGSWTVTPTSADNEIFDNDTAGVFTTAPLVLNDNWWGDHRGVRKSPTLASTAAGDSVIGALTTTAFRTDPVHSGTVVAGVRRMRNIGGTGITNASVVAISVRVIDSQGLPVPFIDVDFTCDVGTCTSLNTTIQRELEASSAFASTTPTTSSRRVQTNASGMAEIRLNINSQPGGSTVVRATAVTSGLFTTVTVDH